MKTNPRSKKFLLSACWTYHLVRDKSDRLLAPVLFAAVLTLSGCDSSQANAQSPGKNAIPQEEAPTPEMAAASPAEASAPAGIGLSLLSSDGKALPILLPENPAPRTRQAANYLADCIEKIGGVRPEVSEGSPSPVPPRAIWVGYQPAMAPLFPGIDFTFEHPEEILLAVNENHAAITGRDVWDPAFPTYPGRRFPIENWQKESGTANAVFTFLQDHIGVRWLYPGELGTDFPGPESLNVAPFSSRYHPQFRSRSGIFHQLALGYMKAGEEQDWAIRSRILYESLPLNGGHYFKDWWDKYGESNPELFALQPDGTRGTHPAATHRRKLCEGEPAVWATWLGEQKEHLAQNPMDTILPAMPNDGYFDGHCTDPRSRAWDPDPSETDVRVTVKWAGGVSEDWVPLSDRYVTFANTLAEMVKKEFPDKDLLVSTNAYGDVGRPLPVKARPADNVLIISVANFHMRHPKDREAGMKEFEGWAKISPHIIWRPNLGNQAGLQWGLPDVPFHQAMEDFRFVAERGAVGVFFDMYFEHWANLAPYYYLVTQLAWNPFADGDAILDDYFQRCYGPASGPMKQYWMHLENTRQKFVDAVESRFRVMEIHNHYSNEVLDEAAGLLDEAARLAAAHTDDAKFADRVNFTRSGFEYLSSIVEIRSMMQRFEGGNQQDKELEDHILAKWEALIALSANFPPYAVNMKRVSPSTGSEANSRLAGLHPSTPVTRRMLRSITTSGLDLD